MRWMAVALVLAAAACGDDPGGHDWGGGGGPGGGSSHPDAGPDAAASPDAGEGPTADAQTGTGIFGKLCEATNLLSPEACPATTAFNGVIVAHIETGAFIAAAPDGAFELPAVFGGTSNTLRAAPDDPVFRSALYPLELVGGEAGPLKVPVMREEDWITLTNTVGASNVDLDSTVFVYAIDRDGDGNVIPLSGVVASVDEGTIYYDDGGPLSWRASDITGTGSAGVVWVNAIRPPLSQMSITLVHGVRSLTLTAVPLEADATTFVFADFGG